MSNEMKRTDFLNEMDNQTPLTEKSLELTEETLKEISGGAMSPDVIMRHAEGSPYMRDPRRK